MSITRDSVLHVARLARLELSDEEVTRLEGDLAKVLAYVGELAELSTDGVPETSHVAAECAPLRADVVAPSLGAEQALAEAPRRAGKSFAVPAFVEE